MLDFEVNPTLTSTVQVVDQFGLSDTATITVNLTNVNETPTTTGLANVNTLEDAAPDVVKLLERVRGSRVGKQYADLHNRR